MTGPQCKTWRLDPDTLEAMKRCSNCFEFKVLTDFYRKGRGGNGEKRWQSRCIACNPVVGYELPKSPGYVKEPTDEAIPVRTCLNAATPNLASLEPLYSETSST